MRITGGVFGDKTDFLQHFDHFFVVFRAVMMTLDAQTFLNDVLDGHTGVERVDGILEDHLNLVEEFLRGVVVVITDLADLLTLLGDGLADIGLDRGDFDFGFVAEAEGLAGRAGIRVVFLLHRCDVRFELGGKGGLLVEFL